MWNLEIQRVKWAEKDIPEDRKEYQTAFSTAVGCLEDWKHFARQRGMESVTIYDKKGNFEKVIKLME
jgi:hypothetical protein